MTLLADIQAWRCGKALDSDGLYDLAVRMANALHTAPAEGQQPFGWIYRNEERCLRAHGTAMIYEQKQVFSLLPHEEGTPLYTHPTPSAAVVRDAAIKLSTLPPVQATAVMEVIEYYDRIVGDHTKFPPADAEADFVMTAAEYRLLRTALLGQEKSK